MGGLDTLTTGLNATYLQQQQSQLNIANMAVDGYCRHEVILSTQVNPKGQAVGVDVLEVLVPNDPILFEEMQNQGSTVGFAGIISGYLEQLQPFFGLFGREDNLAAQTTEAFNQLELTAQNPENVAFAKTALLSVSKVTSNINKIANEVQNQRLAADTEIGVGTETVNGLLLTYHKINENIVTAKARGHNPLDFETQRDYLCLQVAKYIPVKQAPQENGSNWLYLTDGTLLVTEMTVQNLDFTRVSAMSPQYDYPANPGPLSGLTIGGHNVTNAVSPGQIGGLFALRDRIFPAIQNQLDSFAGGLRDQLNAHHNAGTAYAAPQTLTGNKTCVAATPFNATGTLRVAVVGANKKFVAYRDINLTALVPKTVQGFITAFNAGLAGSATATLTAQGVLQLQATAPGNSIALISFDPLNPAIETTTQQGISDFFGLNNMVESGLKPIGLNTPATILGIANVITASPRLLANPALYANGTLSTEPLPIPPNPQPALPPAPPLLETWALTNGDNSNGLRIAAAYKETWTFPAAGGLATQVVTLNNYAINLVTANAYTTAEATTASKTARELFSSLKGQYKEITGVSESEDVAKLSFYAQQIGVLTSAAESFKKTNDLLSNLMRA